jgi:hypothetical protein
MSLAHTCTFYPIHSIIVSILGMKKLNEENVSHLPEVTQVINGSVRFELGNLFADLSLLTTTLSCPRSASTVLGCKAETLPGIV